ncbi:MAG TPA: DUF2203 domain-containing protein [Candidatus Acidoferrales bacterium]|nr:DUF2203 domain-containing protein [Candidatus Acidoferrales bacterium]
MKLFSPERANALIPVLTPLIEELWAQRQSLAIALLEADPALRAAHPTASPSPQEEGRRLEERRAAIRRTIERIQAHGCIVKDIDLGLLDFPAVREGRPVYLCWKAGEPAVAYWHGTDENFSLRKGL